MASDLAAVRSLLFVAADDGDALAAALDSAADAVVADLEDSVAADRKERAREVVAAAFAGAPGRVARLVRVNVLDSPLAAGDLELVAELELDGLVVPRATPAALALLPAGGPPVVAVVESAAGVRAAFEIASHPRVRALALGAKDLGLDLGLEVGPEASELLYARSKVVVDGVAAGIANLFDRVCPGNRRGVEEDARAGRALGFRGKSTLAIADVEAINRVFASDRARRMDCEIPV